MRRLRASFASSHSGGAGAPPGGTTASCQELADTDVARAGDLFVPRQSIRAKRGPASHKRCRWCAGRRLRGESRAASQGLTCACRRIVVPHFISVGRLRVAVTMTRGCLKAESMVRSVSRTRRSVATMRRRAGTHLSEAGPGSAAHHSASLHAAPRPGHETVLLLIVPILTTRRIKS